MCPRYEGKPRPARSRLVRRGTRSSWSTAAAAAFLDELEMDVLTEDYHSGEDGPDGVA
jgi:hypothetical protein